MLKAALKIRNYVVMYYVDTINVPDFYIIYEVVRFNQSDVL
jgi:hypothetical protein